MNELAQCLHSCNGALGTHVALQVASAEAGILQAEAEADAMVLQARADACTRLAQAHAQAAAEFSRLAKQLKANSA